MKPLIFALCVVFAFGGLSAQRLPGSHRRDIRKCRYGRGRCPIAQPVPGPENVATTGKDAGRRQAVGLGEERVAANDDGLFANRKKYGRCGGRVSWRGL